MPVEKLHIISFDNPYPPDYGGIVDVYFKIRALHRLGILIHLHCFTSDATKPTLELESICEELHFYPISKNPALLLSGLPFSVASRNHPDLAVNLSKVDAPILFDGMKTTFLVSNERFSDRRRILRLHNIEQDYFAGVASSERSVIKRILFNLESSKYKRFEPVISRFDGVATISQHETNYIRRKYGSARYVPVFHGNDRVRPMGGFGKYCLYHGDLSTSDNVKSALLLISAFRRIPDIELVIASGTGNAQVNRQISKTDNVRFVRFADFSELQQLFDQAHINISWSLQQSGTKLKLVNALFNGRHSIINENITDDELLVGLCTLASDENSLVRAVKDLMTRPYDDLPQRQNTLDTHLNDVENARLLIEMFR